jgi:asparagine synthase (glutamine-hydrolysing)
MMSDFPIANLLSGGVDSTAIALGMKGIRENIFFDFGTIKPDNKEKINIDKLKKELNISEIVIEPLSMDDIDEYVKASDEIVGDFAGLIYHRLMKEVNNKNYRVVLNGTGGDELFFGYRRYAKIGWFKNALGLVVNKSPNYRPYDFLKKGFWNNCGISSSCDLDINKDNFPTASEYYRFIDFQNYLPYTLLRYTDRISSYHQIEARTPFLDVDLVNFVFQKMEFSGEIGVKRPLRRFISSRFSDLAFNFKEGLGLPIEKIVSNDDLRNIIIPRILTSKIYEELEELSLDKFKINSRIGKWRTMSLYLLVLWHEEHSCK